MTNYIEWLDDYSVGVRVFDDAHRKLLGITNTFVTACIEHKPSEELTDLLVELIRYTHYHFRDEEELLRKTGYDGFDHHQAQHDALFDQVVNLTRDVFHGRLDRPQIAEFMMDWLLTHILEEDMQYRAHFERLGIA